MGSFVTEDARYRYRAHVHVTVEQVGTDAEAGITLDTPLNLQAVEAVITVALAAIRTLGEVDPAVLAAGRQLLAGLPMVLDRVVNNWTLMPVAIVRRDEGRPSP